MPLATSSQSLIGNVIHLTDKEIDGLVSEGMSQSLIGNVIHKQRMTHREMEK